jgi:hypothetical protein
LSNEEAVRLSAIIRNHMRPIALREAPTLTRRIVHRFWRATGEAGLDVCVLTLADYLGIVGVTFVLQDWIAYLELVGGLLDGYFNQHDTVVSPPPLLSGRDLMDQLSLPPGPDIGRLLTALSEAQASGEISTQAEALALARFLLNTPQAQEAEGDDGADGTASAPPRM